MNDQLLQKQLDDFEKAEVRIAEHYRYAALLQWLHDHAQGVEDDAVKRLANLLRCERCTDMAIAVGLKCLQTIALTDGQFDMVAAVIDDLSEGDMAAILRREACLRKLRTLEMMEDVDFVHDFVVSESLGDSVVQTYLLMHFAIEHRERLELFANQGRTKRIRNLARVQLRSIESQKKQQNARSKRPKKENSP